MKEYSSTLFHHIEDAVNACTENQDWHVVNIYPTGWQNQVCVVFYRIKD